MSLVYVSQLMQAMGKDSDVTLLLKEVRPSAGSIDLLLTDMIMPGATGRSIAKQISSLRPGIKVLYMSGYTDDTLIQSKGFEEGDAFLQKPLR